MSRRAILTHFACLAFGLFIGYITPHPLRPSPGKTQSAQQHDAFPTGDALTDEVTATLSRLNAEWDAERDLYASDKARAIARAGWKERTKATMQAIYRKHERTPPVAWRDE